MKAVCESIYERGSHAIKYLRRRIPADVRLAYPTGRTHITRSLGTSDLREAKALARAESARIDEEFQQARQALVAQRAKLKAARASVPGGSPPSATAGDVDVVDAGAVVEGLRPLASASESLSVVVRLLQSGDAAGALSALAALVTPEAEPQAVVPGVASVASQASVPTGTAPGGPTGLPSQSAALPTWDEVFEKWRDFVPDRPRSTAIAAQTPWRHLGRFMNARAPGGACASPALVTPVDMTAFVEDMRGKGLAVDTVNERLSKVKAIYKIAVGRHMLTENPALHTLGCKESSAGKRRKRRLPFDAGDLNRIFGSDIFTKHLRSNGQSGEASYWIPLLLYYTGARPEEVAGLALQDVVKDAEFGWYFNLIDRPTGDDHDLFGDVPVSHRRTLKNGHSIRRVPVAPELMDLGLGRYIDHLRAQGSTVLFPSLEKDWHGKLSGAFSKFFGRYKRVVGIHDERKVMYSFRHTMKDLLEAASVPSKYLQRLLGHTSGDGSITDGYGSDVPFPLLVEHFSRIRFHPLPALPWEPGKGSVRTKSA